MSKIYVYRRNLTSQGTFSGHYSQKQPISLSGNYGYRIIKVSLSPEIPNVFTSIDGTKTDVLWITRDGGANWLQVNLIPGVYTIQRLNLAVATACFDSGWITDLTDNPITLGANKVNGFTYVNIVSSFCGPGAICGINFGKGAAPFDPKGIVRTGEMLGYGPTAEFIGDGLYDATSIPLLDWQSSRIDLLLSFTNSSYDNGTPSNLCTEINLPTYSQGVEITFPRFGDISPILTGAVPNYFSGCDIAFVSSRTKKNIEWSYGECYVSWELFRL